MSRGNSIIVKQNRDNEAYYEYIVKAAETHLPGVIVQEDNSVAVSGGKFTAKLYGADASGGNPKSPYYLVVEDKWQGKLMSDSYSAGTRAVAVVPRHGDEYNILVKNLAGTADDHTTGEIVIIDDTTGKFVVTTGSPEDEVAKLNETITDPTADTLCWASWIGKG